MINFLQSPINNKSLPQEETIVKILLVDDKKENLYLLEQLLADDEYNAQFVKCTSGNEALKVALKEEFALILLDVQMPGMDGYEVARFLKENTKTRAIPIIFVTALDHDASYILEGYKKGAVDYLFKPLNPSITKAKVKAFIIHYLQQKELEQKNMMLQNLVMLINNSIDLMCIAEEKTLKIKNVNPSCEQVLKISSSEMLGRPLLELPFDDGGFEMLEHTLRRVIVLENSIVVDGERKWFSWSFVNENGCWYGNGKDVTQNKLIERRLSSSNDELEREVSKRTSDLSEANEQLRNEIEKRNEVEEELIRNNQRLEKLNEELDSFVYAASHDLKSPMSNIEMLVSILRKKLQAKISEEEIKLFEMMGHSVKKFNAILKDLTEVTSVEKDSEERQEVNLQDIFESVKEDVAELINKCDPVFQTNFEVATVYSSRKNVRSIMFNLISNALKYRSPDRQAVIEISATDAQAFHLLSVKDNGLGMTALQRDRLFGMFRRFHSHVEGSGIGLFLLKKIIENSDGKIEVLSSQNEGSEFRVYLKK